MKHSHRYEKIDLPYWKSAPHIDPDVVSLGQYRWDPVPHASERLTWLTGMRTMTTAGDVNTQVGMASHIYLVTASMVDEYFYSADSELLIVPQEGRLRFCTELGIIDLEPKEIAIIPRGMLYRVEVLEGPARGFVAKTMAKNSPYLDVVLSAQTVWQIGAISNPLSPHLRIAKSQVVLSLNGAANSMKRISAIALGCCRMAWNYAPCKYDLRTYCPVGAVLFDHPDPSIFTVLTAPSGVEGTANIDFVLFRERWMVAENTFRPPWYHKNIMSELMGNIYGSMMQSQRVLCQAA